MKKKAMDEIGDDDLVEGFGIDSAGAVTLAFDIEEALGLENGIEPEVLFKHDTVNKLADFMLSQSASA